MKHIHIFLCAVMLLASAFPACAQEGVSLPIFYDAALATKGFPNPLVKMQIAGHEAIFIVDTGASTHILADWFVELARIPNEKTDTRAQGTGGQTVPTRVVRKVQGRWSDGQEFTLGEGVVITFPPYFKSLQLGGLISPQLLGPAGTAAVLNLTVPSLRFLPWKRALSDLRRSNGPEALIDQTPSCQNARSKFRNRLYVAPGSVAGATDLMLVDTGSTGTILSAESKLARAVDSGGERGSRSEGIGGAVSEERTVRDVSLRRGGQTVVLDASIGKVSQPCDAVGEIGRLGMDALRSCVLILADSELAFSCR